MDASPGVFEVVDPEWAGGDEQGAAHQAEEQVLHTPIRTELHSGIDDSVSEQRNTGSKLKKK